VIEIVAKCDPAMSGFFPYQTGRSRKQGVGKLACGHADMVGQRVQLSKQVRHANRAEMISELSPRLVIANVDLARPLDPDLLPVKKGAHAKGRPGPALAFATDNGRLRQKRDRPWFRRARIDNSSTLFGS
jgi:hypothetical protein